VKKAIKSVLHRCGVDIRRYRPDHGPGSQHRNVGSMVEFVEDVRARGFVPRGIIDVGANRGDWTRMALEIFPDACVIMIEPRFEMVAPLEALCREKSNVSVVKAGAGSEPGQLLQTIWEDLAGSSFLPPEDAALQKKGRQRVTPIVTIDSVLADRCGFHPDFVKLDIQGFELQALAGATSIFGRAELLVLEVSLFAYMTGQPTAREVITFMGDRGYEIYDLPGFLRRPLDGALGQMDIAFVKRSGFFRKSNQW
jgi:FkbM family methyltransferase